MNKIQQTYFRGTLSLVTVKVISRYLTLVLILLFFLDTQVHSTFLVANAQLSEDLITQSDFLRSQMGAHIEIQGSELIDTFIYDLKKNPIFEKPTQIVLAAVSPPLGTNSALSTFLENHTYRSLLSNTDTKLIPVHCPTCLSTVVVSRPNATFMLPAGSLLELKNQLSTSSTTKTALYLDFEAEGSDLVLRIKVTNIESPYTILMAKSYSSVSSVGVLFRDPLALKSPEVARAEYQNILKDRSLFHFPLKVIYRDYKSTDSGIVPPLIWFELGLDAFLNPNQDWLMGIALGLTSLDKAHTGYSYSGRVGRLLTGAARSLSRPDIYFIVGLGILEIKGTDAAAFLPTRVSERDRLLELSSSSPRVSFSAYKVGFELRMQNRFGLTLFAETSPTLKAQKPPSIGSHFTSGPFNWQTIGAEIGVWF